jgi:hypothetical protein
LPLEETAALSSALASALATIPDPTIATNVELESLLGHAEQQELLGCTVDRECLARIARLAKSDYLLVSTAGRVGANLVLTLTLIDTTSSTPVGKVSDTAGRASDAAAVWGKLARELLKVEAARPAFQLPQGAQMSFAVLDLAASGVAPETARNLTQVLSAAVKSVAGSTVISSDDVAAMLQMSETKARMGCLDDTSCIAEIGGALGVQKLVVGTVGLLGASYVVSLRLIDAKRVSVDNRTTESFTGTEDQLIGATKLVARRLLGVQGEGPGQLVVTASEPEADVFLNDEPAGQLPRPPFANLAPGQHRLRIEKQGFELWQSDVYVEPNGTAAAWAQLTELPARWYQQWWVWTIIGAAVVGSGTAAYFMLRGQEPDTDLGIYALP